MSDIAALGFEIDSAQARTAAKDLDKLAAAADKTERSAKKLSTASRDLLRDESGRFMSAAQAADKYGSEIEALRMKYNPLYAASKQFEAQQGELHRALALGAISVAQYDAALEGLQGGMVRSDGAAQQFGKSMQASSAHTTNLMFQLQDIGMMLLSGQNPLMLAMQQGSQIAGVFKQMEDTGESAVSAIKDALLDMIGPTSLLTLGLIAGGAALVEWGMSAMGASEDARTIDDVFSGLSDNISKINSLNKFSNSDGIAAMGAAYGVVTAEIREMIAAQKYAETEVAKSNLREILETFKNDTGTTIWQSWLGDTSGSVMVSQSIIDAENRIANLQSLLSLTENDAKSLGAAMEAAFSAKNLQDQISKLATVRQYLELVAKAGGQGAGEAAKMLAEIVKAEDEARKLLSASGQLPASFSSAANAASRIADELNRAVSAAARLAASAVSDVRFAQIELDFRTDDIGKAGALAAAKFDAEVGKNVKMDSWLYNSLRSQAVEGAKETARIMGEVKKLDDADRDAEKGGSKGAAEMKAAEKGFQSIQELLQKESIFQEAEYEKRHSQLETALEKGLITQQTYKELEAQLQTSYFGTEFEKRQLQYDMSLEQLRAYLEAEKITREQYAILSGNLHSSVVTELGNQDANRYSNDLGNMAKHMGEMNSIAGGGYDKLLKAQKVFGAASALISTYTGAAEALKLPFPYNIAAAGKVIAAGLGFVNAIKGGGSGGSGGSGGGSASATTSATTATRAEPERVTRVELQGEDWMVSLAESMMSQIYDASKNGRVIVARA